MFSAMQPPSLNVEDYKNTTAVSSNVKVLFPSIIFEQKVDGFDAISDELIGYCYGERGRDPTGNTATNVNGWQSKADYHLKESTVKTTLSRGLSKIGGFREGYGLRLNGMWININPPGALNNGHNHPNCDLAGVYWIKTQPDCGKIEFENPNYYNHPNVQGYSDDLIQGCELFPAYDFEPRAGQILLFPSYLRHGVHVNRSNEDRISCSFNCTLEKV
tara:strand:+ start:131 stop:781 length:651 start_codon:yes stop_codon:yes gene_type:complete